MQSFHDIFNRKKHVYSFDTHNINLVEFVRNHLSYLAEVIPYKRSAYPHDVLYYTIYIDAKYTHKIKPYLRAYDIYNDYNKGNYTILVKK